MDTNEFIPTQGKEFSDFLNDDLQGKIFLINCASSNPLYTVILETPYHEFLKNNAFKNFYFVSYYIDSGIKNKLLEKNQNDLKHLIFTTPTQLIRSCNQISESIILILGAHNIEKIITTTFFSRFDLTCCAIIVGDTKLGENEAFRVLWDSLIKAKDLQSLNFATCKDVTLF